VGDLRGGTEGGTPFFRSKVALENAQLVIWENKSRMDRYWIEKRIQMHVNYVHVDGDIDPGIVI